MMKLTHIRFFGCKLWTLAAAFSLALFFSSFQDTDKEKALLMVMMQGLKEMHYQPQEMNDAFSKKVFDLYIKRIDPNKRFLLQEDITALSMYKAKIDDQINEQNFDFYNMADQLIQKRMEEARAYFTTVLSKPFDYGKDETLELEEDNLEFAASKDELKERWRKGMKYETMLRLTTSMQIQDEAREKNDTTVKQKSLDQLEKESRERTLKVYNDYFDRLEKLERSDRLAVYLNSIANVFDPHTEYFAPKDKEDFDISMSGQLEGIGAQLQEKDGQIKVVSIVPGSASYRQGELKVGDVIIKVAQGKEEPVDVIGMPLDKAVQLIRGKKGTEVRLTVKKPDGNIKVIPIVRDIVVLEETYAKSAIIEKNGKKVGYIKLPGFYADFNRANGRSSAEDIKKELNKLKQDNVSSIILDLRNNGGGSLDDVVKMAGYFIRTGPVVQVKTKMGKAQVLSDHDPEVVYDGPLVIMVNTLSASASEILAAALQDYNRAIIIGSSSTFGKGTVQRFFDLDDYLASAYRELGPLGALKMTLQNFYRINGESTQLQGVVPDIIVPDPYDHLDIKERNQDYPMPHDKIEGLKYTSYNIPSKESIVKESMARIRSDNNMQLIEQQSREPLERKANSIETLKLEAFVAEKKKDEAEAEKYENIGKDLPPIEIMPLSSETTLANADSVKIKIREDWFKSIKEDVILREALAVATKMK